MIHISFYFCLSFAAGSSLGLLIVCCWRVALICQFGSEIGFLVHTHTLRKKNIHHVILVEQDQSSPAVVVVVVISIESADADDANSSRTVFCVSNVALAR
mmetsp:Transcript_10192/g.17085  ORF Transcript_10192/g.17085 Transcript_10192/m.17085 type:complete len:100 (-) Transcript_10192:908-1207(-)